MRTFVCDKSGKRLKCAECAFYRRYYQRGKRKVKVPFGVYKCLDCQWVLCRRCALTHFR